MGKYNESVTTSLLQSLNNIHSNSLITNAMKQLIYLMLTAGVFISAACKKDSDGGSKNCDLPSTNVPAELVGKWVNGYTSFTQVVDAYNGRILGTTWKSGRYLQLESNGKNAEMYIMGGSQFS